LNPGLAQADLLEADNKRSQQFWFRQRQGWEGLRSQIGRPVKSWWVSRTKCFNVDPEVLREKMAVLEICPYHSKAFKDHRLLAELPSCQASIRWAQDVLFPQARSRKRVVICLRAAKRWGLTPGTKHGTLFAPLTNRSGHMVRGDYRDKAIRAVQKILGLVSP
jgi:hypothetical protein